MLTCTFTNLSVYVTHVVLDTTQGLPFGKISQQPSPDAPARMGHSRSCRSIDWAICAKSTVHTNAPIALDRVRAPFRYYAEIAQYLMQACYAANQFTLDAATLDPITPPRQ